MARRAAIAAATLLVLVLLGACEHRPPVDVWGHDNSTSKHVSLGLPF